MSARAGTALVRLSAWAALFGAWELLFRLRLWPDYVFPSPWAVAQTLAEGLGQPHYWQAIGISLGRLFIGYGLSLALGGLIGASLAASRRVDEALSPLLLGLQTLPSVCWLPLSLLWFGLNDRAIIFVVVMGSVLSIALATQSAFRQVPPLLVQAGRTLGARGLRLYLHVVIPAAFPALLEGMKQGWSFAWRSLMGGELLFVSLGIGHLLNVGRELNDMNQVLAVMVIIIGIGLVTDRLMFAVLERRVAARWGFRRA